jgi:hypothetical protein
VITEPGRTGRTSKVVLAVLLCAGVAGCSGAPTPSASPPESTAGSASSAPDSAATSAPSSTDATAAPASGHPKAPASGSPTLGSTWSHTSRGYGQVRPSVIDNGGDGNGIVEKISWSSWGAARATGEGMASYVPPGAPLAEGREERATVVAFDLGSCPGHASAYTAVTWYFPQHGEKLDPARVINACTGDTR